MIYYVLVRNTYRVRTTYVRTQNWRAAGGACAVRGTTYVTTSTVISTRGTVEVSTCTVACFVL
jgi:hypothetical protein